MRIIYQFTDKLTNTLSLSGSVEPAEPPTTLVPEGVDVLAANTVLPLQDVTVMLDMLNGASVMRFTYDEASNLAAAIFEVLSEIDSKIEKL